MKLYIDPAYDLDAMRAIARDMGIQLYEERDEGTHSGRLSRGRRRLSFMLRPLSGSDTFRLIREDPYSKSGRRRAFAVCWHGHWHFMRRVFELDPSATFDTSVDRWDGLADFLDRARRSAARNIGSMMYPNYYDDACDCYGSVVQDTYERTCDQVSA